MFLNQYHSYWCRKKWRVITVYGSKKHITLLSYHYRDNSCRRAGRRLLSRRRRRLPRNQRASGSHRGDRARLSDHGHPRVKPPSKTHRNAPPSLVRPNRTATACVLCVICWSTEGRKWWMRWSGVDDWLEYSTKYKLTVVVGRSVMTCL